MEPAESDKIKSTVVGVLQWENMWIQSAIAHSGAY